MLDTAAKITAVMPTVPRQNRNGTAVEYLLEVPLLSFLLLHCDPRAVAVLWQKR